MKRKNVLVRLMVIVLLLGFIFGGNQLINAASLKPITFTVFIAAPGQQPTPDNRIYKLIQKELGVTLKFEYLVGQLEEKMGVMIAGGDYPDVLTGHTRWINAGALIPLEDLMKKHAPNLWKHHEPYLNMVKEPKDGHIYFMPNYGRYYGKYLVNDFWGPAFWIQKAVLKEFGYPKVKSLDQYFDLIEKYKAKYPEIDGMPTLGFEILSDSWRNFCLKNAPQHLIGHPNDGGVVVDYAGKTYKAEIFADKDYAKRYYKKLNEMNAKGLIDRETFVLTYDQYMAKMSSGRVLGSFDQKWNFNNANSSLEMQKKMERTYAPCPVVFDPKTTKDWYMDRAVLNLNNGFGITKNCKDPVRFLKFLDALMSEKWQKIIQWGIKGQDYLVDKKGMFYRNEKQRVEQNDLTWKLANKAQTIIDYAPKMEGTFSDGNATSAGIQPGEFYESLRPFDKEFLAGYKYKTWADFYSTPPPNPIPYPAWQINLIDGTPAKMFDTKLDDLQKRYLPMAILAKPEDFDKVWDEYVAEIHKLDIKAYEDRVNEQIQWRLKNWGSGK